MLTTIIYRSNTDIQKIVEFEDSLKMKEIREKISLYFEIKDFKLFLTNPDGYQFQLTHEDENRSYAYFLWKGCKPTILILSTQETTNDSGINLEDIINDSSNEVDDEKIKDIKLDDILNEE